MSFSIVFQLKDGSCRNYERERGFLIPSNASRFCLCVPSLPFYVHASIRPALKNPDPLSSVRLPRPQHHCVANFSERETSLFPLLCCPSVIIPASLGDRKVCQFWWRCFPFDESCLFNLPVKVNNKVTSSPLILLIPLRITQVCSGLILCVKRRNSLKLQKRGAEAWST